MPLVPLTDWYAGADGQRKKYMRGNPITLNVPGIPTGMKASLNAAGDTITVGWVAPVSDGGSPITGYTVKQTTPAGPTNTAAAGATSSNFVAAAGVTSWVFTVAAFNDVGTGNTNRIALNIDPTPPPTGGAQPRWPGDTSPLQTGNIIWGVNEYDKNPKVVRPPDASAAEYFAPEAGTGAVFGGMRWYYTNWAAFDTGGAARSDAINEAYNQGRIAWMSQNPGDWHAGQMGATNQGIMDRMIAWVEETFTGPFIFTIEHEPDAGTKVGAQGTYAEWMAIQRWFRGRMDAYANAHGGVANYKWKNLSFAPIFTANGFNNGEVNSFIPTPVADKKVFDFIGVDPYVTTHTLAGFTSNFTKAVAWAKQYGWAIGVGEWSVMNDDPQGAAKIQDMYDKCTNGINDVWIVCYFNSGVTNNSQAQYWPIKNLALNGFMGSKLVALAKVASTVHFWDLVRPDGRPFPKPAGF